MKVIKITCSVLALSVLSSPMGRTGDYTYSGSKDVAKAVLAEPSDIDVSFIMPGWLAGVEGDIGFTPVVTTGIDAGIDDILPTIDMIAAATMEVRKGKLGFILDGMYMKLSVEGETPGPLLNDIGLSVRQALVEGVITYRFVENDRAWVELLTGARYQYQGNEVTFNRFGGVPGDLAAVNAWVDPFIGIQAHYQLTDKLYAKARADYGGFDVSSDSTYNLFGVFGYKLTEKASTELGYRYLYTDYTHAGFTYDVAMKGAFIGLRFDY